MPSPFDAQTMSLGQLFSSSQSFQTPPFQRSFVWEEDEAAQLLEDLVAAQDAKDQSGESAYFLGSMVFLEIERPSKLRAALPFARQPPHLLEVIDGLQRLTTLTILFCVLRDLDVGSRPNERLLAAIGDGAAPRQRLQLRKPDESFLHAHVREPGATRVAAPDGSPSSAARRIIEVRNHLREAVGDLDAGERQRLVEFLLDKCHVTTSVTQDIDRAHQMFTVLNARGKPLARNDILKADLLGGVPPAAQQRATAIWHAAEQRLGDQFESLFSHIRAIHGRSSPQVISGIRSVAAESGGGQAFVEGVLQPAAEILDSILHARHSGSPHSASISASLTYLSWLKGTDWVPPALLWWIRKGRDAGELAWFLDRLERLAYSLRIQGHGAKRRISRFAAVVHAIRNGKDLKSPTSPLHLAREELRTIHHNLRDLHKRGAPLAKLVLLRLNDHIAGRPQHLDLKTMTVEHLLPRKPGVNSQWRDWFADPAERDKFTECLGNLVLTSKALNDKASNLDFARKKDVLFDTPDTPLVAVNDYVRRQSEWRVAQIVEREAELLSRLDELWGIGGSARGPAGGPPAQSKKRKEPQAAGA
jgi:Protein of unknown function DUF262/Protein of unknown function (DUF1524)